VELSRLHQGIDYRYMVDILMGKGDADLVLMGGKVIDVITGEIYPANVAVYGHYIVHVGEVQKMIGSRTKVVDVSGYYLSPGFIDSHMHFESSMLTISEFCRLSLPSGTTTLIADPHEIGNALGPSGIKAMAEEALKVPQDVYLVVPALAPDSPGLETSGWDISSKDIPGLLELPIVIGIGELQGFSNVKHVYENSPEIIDDLLVSTLFAVENGYAVDGNAPGLMGSDLSAHIIVCGGLTTCHETTTKEECIEKLRKGMFVFMREGSTQKNMAECIKAYTEEKLSSKRLILATDDMVAVDLLSEGHMNEIIRRTINEGVGPVKAIEMATINPSEYWGFKDRGYLGPGLLADIVVIKDLKTMEIEATFKKGKLVSRKKELIVNLPSYRYPASVKNSVRLNKINPEKLAIISETNIVKARAIGLIPDDNLTNSHTFELKMEKGVVQADTKQDVVYIACLERYGRNGNVGKAFVHGFGIKQGAIAESVSHDCHNIIVMGTSLNDLAVAVNRVIEIGGGLVVVNDGKILGDISLPVGGLMTDLLTGQEVSQKISELENLAVEKLGIKVHSPFMHLSFLSLSTSPKWKITDYGLLDVEEFKILPPIVEKTPDGR